MALLKLALSCSKWIAKIKGGMPEDYFTLEKNVAVIDPESLNEKLENMTQFGIYLLDDFGSAYDARNFMSGSNKSLGYILQTSRTVNSIILVSAPHGAMLDVNLHRLAQYYAEVVESHHEAGITVLKILKTKQDFRAGKIKRIYPGKSGVTAMRYYSTLPPAEIKEEYDKIREKNAKIIAAKRGERREAEAAKANGNKPNSKEKFSLDEITKIFAGKGQTPTTILEMAEELGTDRHTVTKYLTRTGYKIERLPKSKKGILVKVP
jgi:hypothetical protein